MGDRGGLLLAARRFVGRNICAWRKLCYIRPQNKLWQPSNKSKNGSKWSGTEVGNLKLGRPKITQ